jgi:hypothetical protein
MNKEVEKQRNVVDKLSKEVDYFRDKLDYAISNYKLELATLRSYEELEETWKRTSRKKPKKRNPHDLFDEERDYQLQEETAL